MVATSLPERRTSGVAGQSPFDARKDYHRKLQERLWSVRDGLPSNSDPTSARSVEIGRALAEAAGVTVDLPSLDRASLAAELERHTKGFFEAVFPRVGDLDEASWLIETAGGTVEFAQYDHLAATRRSAANDGQLAALLYSDCTLAPDLFVGRTRPPVEGMRDAVSKPLGQGNLTEAALVGVVVCKWRISGDIGQEGVDLLRRPEAGAWYTSIVTCEPLSARLASIAFAHHGRYVYHVALRELREVLSRQDWWDSRDLVDLMVDQGRLRDVSDLPGDLAARAGTAVWR